MLAREGAVSSVGHPHQHQPQCLKADGHSPDRFATGNEVLTALGEGFEAALTLRQPPKAALDEGALVAESLIKGG